MILKHVLICNRQSGRVNGALLLCENSLIRSHFFFLAPFPANVSGSDCFTGQSPGTRHDEHEGQKSRAHAGAYEGGGSRLEGGGSAEASARIWLQLG